MPPSSTNVVARLASDFAFFEPGDNSQQTPSNSSLSLKFRVPLSSFLGQEVERDWKELEACGKCKKTVCGVSAQNTLSISFLLCAAIGSAKLHGRVHLLPR